MSAETKAETVHIMDGLPHSSILTVCGLWWTGNVIGVVERRDVEEYRARPDIRICPACEPARKIAGLDAPCPSGCDHPVFEHRVRPEPDDYTPEQLRRLPRHVREGGCSLCLCRGECQ